MGEIKSEGIILKTTPYKDHHRIIQIFTPNDGLLSLFAKGISRPKLQSLLSPLSQIEVIYRKKTSDLYFFKEGFIIQSHHFLRTEWKILEAAGKMGSVLLQTQLPGKASPELYKLLIASLKQLPHFQDPSTLILLFYLKLLTYEGVISWDSPAFFPFPSPHWAELKKLAHTRSFREHYNQKGLGNLVPQLEKLLRELL
jgi:DNA repair protein RecO (recombination protein O)